VLNGDAGYAVLLDAAARKASARRVTFGTGGGS
jgi:UDP-N-acetylmuramoyl-tripeptide--D-alanyl-D-alanine ligase